MTCNGLVLILWCKSLFSGGSSLTSLELVVMVSIGELQTWEALFCTGDEREVVELLVGVVWFKF